RRSKPAPAGVPPPPGRPGWFPPRGAPAGAGHRPGPRGPPAGGGGCRGWRGWGGFVRPRRGGGARGRRGAGGGRGGGRDGGGGGAGPGDVSLQRAPPRLITCAGVAGWSETSPVPALTACWTSRLSAVTLMALLVAPRPVTVSTVPMASGLAPLRNVKPVV